MECIGVCDFFRTYVRCGHVNIHDQQRSITIFGRVRAASRILATGLVLFGLWLVFIGIYVCDWSLLAMNINESASGMLRITHPRNTYLKRYIVK